MLMSVVWRRLRSSRGYKQPRRPNTPAAVQACAAVQEGGCAACAGRAEGASSGRVALSEGEITQSGTRALYLAGQPRDPSFPLYSSVITIFSISIQYRATRQ